jgi:hypothetical protein
MKRRRWIWIPVGVFTLFVAAILWMARPRPDPYAFLSRFHPEYRYWTSDMAGSTPKKGMTVVFRLRDGDTVRQALEKELTPEAGFRKLPTHPDWLEWKRNNGDQVSFAPAEDVTENGKQSECWFFEVEREETWMSQKLAALRAFLHWE